MTLKSILRSLWFTMNLEYLHATVENKDPENFIFAGLNLGYKSQFSTGLYMRYGGSLGIIRMCDHYKETYPWGNLELCLGFAF